MNFGTAAANSGDYYAALGAVGSDNIMQQTIATTAGQTYDFSFYLNSDGGTTNDFTAMFDGATVFSQSNIPTQPYTLYTFAVTASTGSTVIEFDSRDDPGYLHLDDVSVVASTATPEPSSLIGSFLLLGLLAGCGAVYKRRNVQNS